MPRGLLFIGGAGPESGRIRSLTADGDVICAADSGLDAVRRAGLVPDAVLGDMDSVSDPQLIHSYPEALVKVFPADKDQTDTEIGLQWLRDAECSPVVMIGGGEGRLDHTLALRALFDTPKAPDLWYTALEVSVMLNGRKTIQAGCGTTVSFFPAGDGPWKLHTRGLRWELYDLDWNKTPMSLSNRFVSDTAELYAESGSFLVCVGLLDAVFR